mgnify:CR=1 FL=1
MHILVFEPVATGHHMALYFKLFVRAITERGWSLTLLSTQEAVDHPAFELARARGAHLDVLTIPPIKKAAGNRSIDLFQKQCRYFKAVKATMPYAISKRMPDLAFVMNLGHFEKAISVFGSPFGDIPWGGLLISGKFHRHPLGVGPKSRSDVLYRYLFERMLGIKTLRAVGVIDELFLSYVQKIGLDKSSKVTYIPDVGQLRGAQTKVQARRDLGIREDAFVVLVYGSLSRRKGVEELRRALHQDDIPPRVILHLAGRQDETTRDLLERTAYQEFLTSRRIIVSDEFHNEAMEYRAFISADVVWLGYVDGAYGSSGVLYQACSAGLPVVATRHGLIGWLATKHRLGPVVEPTDPAAVSRCIRELVSTSTLANTLKDNAIRLAEQHTDKQFMDAIIQTLILAREGKGNRC